MSSSPSMPGIRMSTIATSGRSRRARSSASLIWFLYAWGPLNSVFEWYQPPPPPDGCAHAADHLGPLVEAAYAPFSSGLRC